MLQMIIVGYLGADAEVKESNGKQFTTCRVAHTDKWKDDAGQVHESTTWVDVIINDKPKVVDYLKKGQLVFMQGNITLRVYSSEKERCMKAGLTLNVNRIELLGGKSDVVPGTLFSMEGSNPYPIQKLFWCQDYANIKSMKYPVTLQSANGQRFTVNKEGFVEPVSENQEQQ